jgi:hypothetical protein
MKGQVMVLRVWRLVNTIEFTVIVATIGVLLLKFGRGVKPGGYDSFDGPTLPVYNQPYPFKLTFSHLLEHVSP